MKFTIITVVKNDFKNIKNTIYSVLNQSYKNIEYIVVDGNSTDGTFNYLKSLKDERVNLYSINDKNLYEALNFGIKKAKGNYIGILHSGDLYQSKFALSKIKKKIKSEDFYFCNLSYFNSKNLITRNWKFKNNKINIYNFYQIAHPTLFVKKKIAKEYYYNERYYISADIDYIINLIKKKLTYKYLNINLTYMKNDGLSSSISKKLIEDINILLRHFNLLFFFILIMKTLSKIPGLILFNKKKIKS
jgi:glycosyltransferase